MDRLAPLSDCGWQAVRPAVSAERTRVSSCEQWSRLITPNLELKDANHICCYYEEELLSIITRSKHCVLSMCSQHGAWTGEPKGFVVPAWGGPTSHTACLSHAGTPQNFIHSLVILALGKVSSSELTMFKSSVRDSILGHESYPGILVEVIVG